MPKMPSRLPEMSVPKKSRVVQPRQPPARTSRSPAPTLRAAASISAMVNSAVACDSTPGVFTTAMPRAAAAARSMCSVPTLNVPMTRTLAGSEAITSASNR